VASNGEAVRIRGSHPSREFLSNRRDMARFMLAHLQDGQFEGTRILRSDTVRLMHSRQFANVPDMNGMALGFYEEPEMATELLGIPATHNFP